MGKLEILFKRYLRKNMSSYLAGTVCLLATNYSCNHSRTDRAAVDVLTTPETLVPSVLMCSTLPDGVTVVLFERCLECSSLIPDGMWSIESGEICSPIFCIYRRRFMRPKIEGTSFLVLLQTLRGFEHSLALVACRASI